MMLEDLLEIAETEKEEQAKYERRINVCLATSCQSSGADQIHKELSEEAEKSGKCKVSGVGCMGLCSLGPILSVEPEERLIHSVTPETLPGMKDSILSGKSVTDHELDRSIPFFQRQKRIVLENSGQIDPERIEEYIARDGYRALFESLTRMNQSEVIDQVARSGLRGRGGGGYPTGLKWSTVAKAHGEEKVVICNADEGDPGAYMDRSVLESDPHRVIEGMAIAAYAVGASEGYIYIRAEYPGAIKRLKLAIKNAERLGLLGNRICGTTFNFHVTLRLGAGAYVCGEETALIASIEGRRGMPSPRPPYPAERGLWGRPTLINNVETFANIPWILRNGGDRFASMGTEKSKGTKVFALVGRLNHTGLIEVPMGITLREIIYEMGGGIPEGKEFKAVQTGGPSGGCIPETLLDMPVDYDSLLEAGSMMGSGGMIVMDESSSMVDVARFFMDFSQSESCGKCVPCRVGTVQMHRILTEIIEGRGAVEDLDTLTELCSMVKSTSLCGLGMSAPNPVLSTLRYFREEYDRLLSKTKEVHESV